MFGRMPKARMCGRGELNWLGEYLNQWDVSWLFRKQYLVAAILGLRVEGLSVLL
jgi:hypothetical protein